MSKRMGRPPSEEPRNKIVGCKLTENELKRLENYCEKNNTTKSDVLKNSLKPIINPESESE